TDSLEQLEMAITKNYGPQALGGIRIRLVREVDLNSEALVDTSRINTGQDLEASDALDTELSEFVSELRLIKDEYEIAELRKSVAATINGFEDVVRNLDKAVAHERGERVVEGAFFARAR
ncbi:Xaa-Pro aminopeptidase, partial [Escherichia coli]|nr:Xaa-Pro aminopeptidase [Escherichia coli]